MSKNPWKDKVISYNKQRALSDEKASDLMTLLDALPEGQVKQLMKDEKCAAILAKYGIKAE